MAAYTVEYTSTAILNNSKIKWTSYNDITTANTANNYLSGTWHGIIDYSDYNSIATTSGTNYTITNSEWWGTSTDTSTIRYKPTWEEISRADRIREAIQQRLSPRMITTRRCLQPTTNTKEIRARETLRKILGDQRFKQLMKNGFITIKAKSGKIYKIHPGEIMTTVYQNGMPVEKLCVALQGGFPPTDALIMRLLLLLNNEELFLQKAIRHNYRNPRPVQTQEDKPLVEIAEDLKTIAA